MKYLFILVCSLPLWATDSVDYLDLLVQAEGTTFTVSPSLHKMLTYSLVNDERYSLRKGNVEQILDAPMRQTAFLLRTLERNRGSLLEKPGPFPVLKFEFTLALRDVKGEVLEKREYTVQVGLDQDPGMGLISVEGSSTVFKFPINTLSVDEPYAAFVTHLTFPFEKVVFAQPELHECFVDLYYKWPELVQKDNKKVFDLFPAWLTYGKGLIKEISVHMGTTFLKKQNGVWQQTPSAYLHAASSAIEEYTAILAMIGEGDVKHSIEALEEYVSRVPGDKKALKQLMDLYIEDDRNDEAYNLITRFQPLFATIRGGLPNQKDLAFKAERKRNWLLGRKGTFHKDDSILLKITAPIDGDLITGTNDLKFTLAGKDSALLAVDCYIGDQLIAEFKEPPFSMPFTVDGQRGDQVIKVVSYFEDESYQEDQIKVSTIKVNASENVLLVGLRASVFQKVDHTNDLKVEDFVVKENDKPIVMETFRKDTAPLRVAILIDTSISMVGPKLHRAQYAVKTFLSKLGPEDRASIYTFDDQVLKLSDFSNDYPEISKQVMTLSMQWGTSLYDAMLIAHDALIGQNGTKVMIVVSDGDDSASATTDIHVTNVIANSPVMVYSVILSGGKFENGDVGAKMLKGIAELSGSISHKVKNLDNLSTTFDQVYLDLKSFYYMEYYSSVLKREDRKLDVSLKGALGKVRTREIQ